MHANAHPINMGDLAAHNIRQEKDHEPKKIDALYGVGSDSQSFSVPISIQPEEVHKNDHEKEGKMK